MPISMELDKGFVGKIIGYKKLINVPNSMSVLDDLLPIAVDMTKREIKGTFNLVNPGTLSHHEVIELYKEIINPSHHYEGFSLEEQNRILKAPRANAELSSAKLLALYPHIPCLKDSLRQLLMRIKREQLSCERSTLT